MKTEELGIIIRVKPYMGNDSWLDCGGEYLTEEGNEEANFASTLENKIMYAIICVSKDLKTWSDWGYKSRKEAEATLKATAPKSKLIYVE